MTLLTGDRVTLLVTGKGSRQVDARPAVGRRAIGFRRSTSDGHMFLIPSDMEQLLASGALDRRLFDITGLVEAGYDDERRDKIPLIVQYGPGGLRTLRNAPGARISRTLDVIDSVAVRVEKARAAEFLSALPRTTRGFGGGIEKIWLDGRSEVLLDRSVPQVKAPQAWREGFTGKGVVVGVLDTGIDARHPDLRPNVVVAARDFTGEGKRDGLGHGTHVASIITGSGRASNGKYGGVAPAAKLVSSKVCASEGFCFESWIIAGMQWAAVRRDVDVINMSLGGFDLPEKDPVELALERLTRRTGALFVVAAGNAGPFEESINTPASSGAALAVGAVRRSDRIIWFSSRGPRTGDGAVKPDITAPGVNIAAARARGTRLGTPVGKRYVRVSGTSMATPHVAGAAAILKQRHPSWEAGRLKQALMASAAPRAELTVYDQGAGRLQVARAVSQTVYTSPASLSFGIRRFPHGDDRPVTKTLTYRNDRRKPVLLRLRPRLLNPRGNPAPRRSLSLSREWVTVPARGTASVRVTIRTDHKGRNGAYSGRIRATGRGVLVTTPLGVVKEQRP